MSWVRMQETNLDYWAQIGPPVITIEVFHWNEIDGTRFFKFHCKRIPPNDEAVGHLGLIFLAYKHGIFCYHCKLCSSGYALAQHSVPLFWASPFNITDFLHYDLMHLLKKFCTPLSGVPQKCFQSGPALASAGPEQMFMLVGTACWRQCVSFATKLSRLDASDDWKVVRWCRT